jgi:hypothetical protein
VRDGVGACIAVAGLVPAVLGLPATGAAASSRASVHVFLTGTVAFAPSNAWTVGWGGVGSAAAGAQCLRWNGTRWVSVKTVGYGTAINGLMGMSATGPADMWGVGFLGGNCLIQHYNGATWANVACPFKGLIAELGVSGTASGKVIAVGGVSGGGHNVPLIESWNGTKFVQVTQPVSAGDLSSVTVLSGTSAYAAGETGSGNTLAEHFDGSTWAQVPAPNPSDGGFLNNIASTPAGSFAEAVGWHGADPNERPLIEQGNGTTWTITRQ